MHKTHAKRRRDIKTKLMAAICMLLVSSIMMVSTTYAWFTLSTAPEVTGINTAVGANGNLEMALQPVNSDSLNLIKSSVGDSTLPAALKNITWGNLVDVSSPDYGLQKIMLYPAKLNTEETADGVAIGQNPLATPTYGADGRMGSLETKTITGIYSADEQKFQEGYTGTIGGQTVTLDNAYGVRAIGVSSGMSDRQLAFRAALTAANTAASKAKSLASQSLNANGAALADIAVKHATAEGAAETYTKAELLPLQTILNSLVGTDPNAADGSLEFIAQALIDYSRVVALNNASDDSYANIQTIYDTVTLNTLVATANANGGTIDNLETYVTNLQETLDKVNGAKATIDGLLNSEAESFAWEEFDDALFDLADPNAMQINGIPVSDLKKDWEFKPENGDVLPAGNRVSTGENGEKAGFVYDEDGAIVSNMGRLVDSVFADGLNLIIRSGAGVYADVADYCGDYSAAVTLSKISYGGMTVKNLDATMSTKTTVGTPYLTVVNNGMPTFNAGVGGSASAAINDFYGYIIDLAFRTNVAGSQLMLQGEAVDRIYSNGTNEATMGGGATMSFTSTVDTFTANQVKNLMSNIRVVFFNTDNRVIIGYARLDVANATTSGSTVTMTLVMTDADGVALPSQAIMNLEQNEIHELSVMVYLDGETITNADVANGVSSMTGTMNLQFSSSATLVPMEYTALKEGTGEEPAAPTFTITDVTDVTATEGYTVTVKHVTNGDNMGGLVAEIKDSEGNVVTEGVTVTIAGQTASYQTFGGQSGWAVSTSISAPSGNVNVTIAPNA